MNGGGGYPEIKVKDSQTPAPKSTLLFTGVYILHLYHFPHPSPENDFFSPPVVPFLNDF